MSNPLWFLLVVLPTFIIGYLVSKDVMRCRSIKGIHVIATIIAFIPIVSLAGLIAYLITVSDKDVFKW
jgi:hypothetical protein